jgi:hypothetical protein
MIDAEKSFCIVRAAKRLLAKKAELDDIFHSHSSMFPVEVKFLTSSWINLQFSIASMQ